MVFRAYIRPCRDVLPQFSESPQNVTSGVLAPSSRTPPIHTSHKIHIHIFNVSLFRVHTVLFSWSRQAWMLLLRFWILPLGYCLPVIKLITTGLIDYDRSRYSVDHDRCVIQLITKSLNDHDRSRYSVDHNRLECCPLDSEIYVWATAFPMFMSCLIDISHVPLHSTCDL